MIRAIKLIITTIILLAFIGLYGQKSELSIKWSEMQEYNHKAEGYFDNIIGSNSKYIYTINNIAQNKRFRNNNKLKIVAFDKNSMQKISDVGIKGFKENEADNKLLDDMYVQKYVIFEDVIYVFWTHESREKDELFVQSFSNKLKIIAPLKKIYEVKSKKGDKKKAELLVLGTSNQHVLIGGELSAGKDENIKLSIKVLKSDLTFFSSKQVTLPITSLGHKSNSLSSEYVLGDNNVLYAFSYIKMTKEQKQLLKDNESSVYCLFSAINIEDGTIQSVKLKYENKNIYNISYHNDKDNMILTGFFSDLNKDGSMGVFKIKFNKNNLTAMSEPSFSYFTPQHIHEITKGQKKNTKKKKKRKPNIDRLLEYSLVKSFNNNGNITFIYTIYHEYSVTTCNSKGSCTTRYYQKNSDILAFSITRSGEINWVSKTERQAFYKGWGFYDVNVVDRDGFYYVVYADDYIFNTEKNQRVKNPKKLRQTTINYLVLNSEDGEMVTNMHITNTMKEPPKTRKYVTAHKIIESDNELYVNSIKIKMKPQAIGISIILIPTLYGAYLPSIITSSFTGTGYLGKIEIK